MFIYSFVAIRRDINYNGNGLKLVVITGTLFIMPLRTVFFYNEGMWRH